MGEKSTCGQSTQELLLEFQQTGSQAPFEEIARRYAGMVYNVALQVTRDAHDAEDATQATFLTLAVHAKTAGKIRYVGPWLRKVSQRLALDIRRSKKRRTGREQRHATTRAASNGNGNGTVSRHDLTIANSMQLEELRAILRDELDRLPTKYRMPLILYYFGGLTPDQIGKELRCKTSTLGVRLHRGRKMLADNLSSRGININSAVVGAALMAMVDSSIRDNLVHSCTHSAVHVAAHGFVSDAIVSAPVLGLVQGITRAIRLSRLKGFIAAGIVLITTLTGSGEAMKRLQSLSPDVLQNLNPMRLIRPLLQRVLRPGPMTLDSSNLIPPNSAARVALQTDYAPLPGAPWQSAAETPWVVQPAIVTGVVAHVGSERLLTSQFESIATSTAVMPIPAKAEPLVLATAPLPSPVTRAQNAEPVATALPLAAPKVSQSVPTAPALVLSTPVQTFDTLIIDRAASAGSASIDGSTFRVSSGVLRARKIVIGDTTDGAFIQDGGQVQVDEAVVIAQQPASNGTYAISNNSTLTTSTLAIGDGGSGTMTQSGAQVTATTPQRTGEVVLGNRSGSNGTYALNDGTLVTDQLIIGREGAGTFQQRGGDVTINIARLGMETGGSGLWSVSSGSVEVSNPVPTTVVGVTTKSTQPTVFSSGPMIVVGGEGAGTILLHSNSAAATIKEQAGARGATLLVRPDSDGAGTIRGWGIVDLTGPFISNGRIIADGFGEKHVLDMSSVSVITNAIENTIVDGTNGWYARDGGSLKLPAVKVDGSREYTWGEFPYDREIDLVNSLRFTPHDDLVGEVDIMLRDPLDPDVPSLTGDTRGISLWEITSDVTLSGVDLLVRYDDFIMSTWRRAETQFVLWAYDGGAWQVVAGEGAGIDIEQNLLWGTANNPQYLAVGLSPDNDGVLTPFVPNLAPNAVVTPEPMSLASLGIAAAGLLMRRRRR